MLFITNWYSTADAPARAVWVREHAKAARIHDDVVVLHCLGPRPALARRYRLELDMDERITDGVPTYRLSYRPSGVPQSAYPIYLWSVFRAVRDLVRAGFRPDIAHAHVYDASGAAALIGALHRIPVVVSEHFSSFPRRALGTRDLLKARAGFRWADVVLPVSHALRLAIERYGIHARYEVIPNVVDTTLFFPPALPRTPGLKRMLFVGELTPIKGIPYLLHALARLRERREDWRLDIVGDGSARKEWEQMAAELRLRDTVTFHGLRTRREVGAFMRDADLFVLPSLCETFSMPVAEALATGLPVLATRCGGPEELVGEDVGLLVPPGDAEALRSGLDDMLDHLPRYSGAHIAAYARDRFSPESVGAQLHAVYRSLYRARAPGRSR